MTEKIRFTQDYEIYRPRQESVYPLQESDWNRLKQMISRIKPINRLFRVFASVCFGISASSILSIITLSSSSGVPNWALPATWSIFFSSALVGIALLFLDHWQKKITNLSADDILQEMKLLEEKFLLEDNGSAEPFNNDVPF
jgi:hypothetical protein